MKQLNEFSHAKIGKTVESVPLKIKNLIKVRVRNLS